MSNLNINKNKKNTSFDKLVTSSRKKVSHQRETYLIKPYEEPLNATKTSIKSNRRKNLNAKTFGDHLVEKEEGIIRIASQNINCIGCNQDNNEKEERAKNWLIQNSVDIVGWQETGVAFHLLPKYKRLSHRMRDIRWNKMRISSSNNRHEANETFQYGGTAVMSFDESAHRIKSTGADPTGLGRWSWIMYEGKNNYFTRVISAYVPCKSQDDRRQTVYNQHRRYFWSKGIQSCPRQLMHQQLVCQIQTWQKKGDNIVLMIDANENLSNMGPLQTMLLHECQLIDPIRNRFHNKNHPLPATSLTGSAPIDSIFVSPSLQNITRGGWLKIEDSIGDHRTIFVDIPIKTLLGENPFHIHRNTARRLVCEQPKVVEKYNKLLNQQLENQGTFQQHNKVLYLFQNGNINEPEMIRRINKIDSSITNSILYAEKRCRKLTTGQVPFSPEISEAGKTINVWNNIIRKKKGCNISSTYIKRISKKVGISINVNQLSLKECEEERNLATKKYRKLKRNAKQSRIQFLNELAMQHAERGNETSSNIVARMNRNEEMRESYRRIKVITKPFFGATEKVLIYDENEEKEEVSMEKITIEKALSEQNIKKFTEAYSSPFLQQPLLSKLGQDASTPAAQSIVQGKFNSKCNISDQTKKFIKQLKMPYKIKRSKMNNTLCSLDEATQYWKKKREKTNSSMSLRHIGTYKALTFNNLPTLKMINNISNIAFNIGEPLERWTHDLDVSLLKKPNKFRPSELRTIGTLEADFNQQAALHFSKRMISNGIVNLAIPSSQYAKKGNRSIEAAVVKVLFFDYLRLTRRNGAFMAMDLKNCFDRMAHPVTSLAAQRLGVSPRITKCMIQTLIKMKHYIRTAYGDSEWSYGGNMTRPLQGAIQGNGAASPMFVAISCVILSYLESQTQGIHVLSAITLTLFSLSIIMYVDDADILIAADKLNDSRETVQQKAQRTATIYQDGVRQTGGAIRPDKCRWYSISFLWKAGKWKYDSTPHIKNVLLQDENGNDRIIQRLEVKTGWKGLGVITAPDGNWNDHMSYLIKDKIQPWNASIQSSYLLRQDVYRAAYTSIFKSIDYTLPATFMNHKQCSKINTELHKKFLPKLGIDVHLPLVYRYGPKKYQGLASLNTENKQFIEKVKLFITHAGTSTQLGQSIQLLLEAMHLQMGTNKHIFSLDYQKYQCLCEIGWITHLWEMTWKNRVEIEGYYEKPMISRENDYSLMDKLIEKDIHTEEDLKKINRCRMYLQAQNLSDIANGHGNRISTITLQHVKDPDRISKYTWPIQPKPPKSDWDAWDDAILHCWTINESFDISPPLQKWINTPQISTPWSYNPEHRMLYYKTSQQSTNVYKMKESHTRTKTSSTFQFYQSISNCNTPTTLPAIVNRLNPKFPILETTFPNNVKSESVEKQKLNEEIEMFFEQVTFPSTTILPLLQDIKNGNARAVTDASVSLYTEIGASSFVITSLDLKTSISGSHGTPRGSTKMDSYRAELYGIFSILICLKHITLEHKINKGSIIIACDNKASLNNALNYDTRASTNQGSYDILWAIQDLKNSIPIKLIPQHVKAHQDKIKTKSQLTLLETLNCLMDINAGEYRRYIEQTPSYKYSKLHQFSNWHCIVNDQTITANLDQTLQEWIYRDQMREYLIKNKNYHPSAFDMIDWTAIDQASKTLTNARQIWLTKHVSGFCATASTMEKRKKWESNLCPLCKLSVEDSQHVIICPDNRVRTKYASSLQKLMDHMKRTHTHPAIQNIFLHTLSDGNSHKFKDYIPRTEIDPNLHEAAKEQDILGWTKMFNGHISSQWAKMQHQHYKMMYQNPPSISHWAKNLILQFYTISHDMWTHRNEIVHEKVEEFLNLRESNQLQKEITESFNTGPTQVLPMHRYMFKDTLANLFNKSVVEKRYWIATLNASRKCFQNRKNEAQNMQEIMKKFATVPD